MISIQRRLSLGLAAALLVCGLLLILGARWLVDSALRDYLSSGLQAESENLLVAVVRGPDGLQLDEQRLNPAYQRPFSGRYFEIDMGEPRWRSRSLWDHVLESPTHEGLTRHLVNGPGEQRLLVYRADYQRLGQKLSIVVAQDYNPLLTSFSRMLRIGAAIGLTALIIILLLQRITVRRALKPLERVRHQIAQLQQGQRSQLDTQVPQELEPLVGQINHLLRHTEDNLKRARHGIGNLGHALKTPLAVLVSLTEREALKAHPALQHTLREQLDQIQQRLERELRKARLAGDQLPGVYLDCEAELPSLCAMLKQIHGREIDIECHVPSGLKLPWDREDLLELLGTLLDNACKWAQTHVRLSVENHYPHYVIRVDDDGPGIAPESRPEILERGVRLDEQVVGHGLGLGIARDIVENCGGTLTLETSPLGGLQVLIQLPFRTSSTTTA
jgi:signal transduction histidine kinase